MQKFFKRWDCQTGRILAINLFKDSCHWCCKDGVFMCQTISRYYLHMMIDTIPWSARDLSPLSKLTTCRQQGLRLQYGRLKGNQGTLSAEVKKFRQARETDFCRRYLLQSQADTNVYHQQLLFLNSLQQVTP